MALSLLGVIIFVGSILYYLYRSASGAANLELFWIAVYIFLLGLAFIGVAYVRARHNLQKEPDIGKRTDGARKLNQAFGKLAFLYGSIFLIFVILSLWGLISPAGDAG